MAKNKTIRVMVLLYGQSLYGRERGNIQVFKFLREAGYEVLFVVDKFDGPNELKDCLTANHFPYRQARMAGLFSKGMSLNKWLTKLSHLFLGSADILSILRDYKPTHIHIADSAVFISVWGALVFSRLPVTYRLGDEPLRRPYPYQLVWKYLIKPRVFKFVCISQFINNALTAIPGKADSKVIYNFPPERHHDRSDGVTLGLPLDKIIITYLGQIHPQKGVILFVEAAAKLCAIYPNVTFVIVGDLERDRDYSNKILNIINFNNIHDRFVFPGFQSNPLPILSQSNIHVMTSLNTEGLGNVVVEAKQAGIPSVIFPTGGTPELIEHRVDGYICGDTTEDSLVEGIRYFLDNQGLIEQAGLAAKASLTRLGITKEHFVKAWRDVYETI